MPASIFVQVGDAGKPLVLREGGVEFAVIIKATS